MPVVRRAFAEAKRFWPIFEVYQKGPQQINERPEKTIRAYADVYNRGPVAKDTAKKLLGDALAVEEAELKLKQSYVPKLEKALPEMKVARYILIENKMRALVRYEIAAAIPLW